MPARTHELTVPLDLSEIADTAKGERVKVVARAADGTIDSAVVKVAGATASATLKFRDKPGAVTVAVGPTTADDAQILDADTVGLQVPSRYWEDVTKVSLSPIAVGLWHWGWWKRWCREITVTGRLVCPDGRPVPGATVTAYDIDSFFIWSSKQAVGSQTTGADGTFTMTFTWCCGAYPWWWWFRVRPWVLDPRIAGRVHDALQKVGDVPLATPTPQPSLAVFEPLLGKADSENAVTLRRGALSELEPKDIEAARERLVKVLPERVSGLDIWPWVPWSPWRDCRPDLVFSATQDCGDGVTVVLDEDVTATRWDVPDQVSVTLVASSEACCLPGGDDESDCLIVDSVCSNPMQHVAGNTGAPVGTPAAVEGYLVTSVDNVDQSLDIPFGGTVPVSQNPSDLVGVDFYALEHSANGGAWVPMPSGACPAFIRRWMLFPGATTGTESFAPIPVGPWSVYETRRHHEDTTYGDWSPGGGRFWLSTNYDLLCPISSSNLVDGRHDVRVVKFTETSPGQFSAPEPVISCDGRTQAGFVLVIDNRTVTALGHDPAHNCGGGVHLCTTEPDTHILEVRVDGQVVGPCDTISASDGTVEIDVLAHDPDGHLAEFALSSHFGVSGSVDLVAAGVVTSLDPGPAASTYAGALAAGAVRPVWAGGRFRITVSASVAFPVPCCYLLRLVARKRTIESCTPWVRNVSEMTLGIGV